MANAIFVAVRTRNRVECLIGVYITLRCQFFPVQLACCEKLPYFMRSWEGGQCKRLREKKKKKNIGIFTRRNRFVRCAFSSSPRSFFRVLVSVPTVFGHMHKCENRARRWKPSSPPRVEICTSMSKVIFIYSQLLYYAIRYRMGSRGQL